MKRIEIHAEAYWEIEEAKHWYESQSNGLGNRFEEEVDRAMQCIREFPDTWPVYIAGTRRFFLHRFPFAVVYQCADKIKVFAVMHLHRKPGYWRNRMH